MFRTILPFLLISIGALFAEENSEMIRKSLVRIEITKQASNYREPWQSGGIGGGVGTGFIIEGKRIMTNAHVISNATDLRLTRDGSQRIFKGKVEYAAHDCDLAILSVDDLDFFKDSQVLSFGEVPKLNTTVTAYGFPIGGSRISITRGVASRIEFRPYVHSGIDLHLAIQIDAAINPGNSGGPIIQDNKVVGVAFQGLSGGAAQNTAYMIPVPVIQRTLQDIKDGKYDGYVDLGFNTLPLHNQGMRSYFGLGPKQGGVLVTHVNKETSVDGFLKENDILLAVNDHHIDVGGMIKIHGELVRMEEIVEKKFTGEKVEFLLLREGKETKVQVTLKSFKRMRLYAKTYDKRPKFILFAGLLFQPMTRNLIIHHKINNPSINKFYANYIRDETYIDKPEPIILTQILADPINLGNEEAKHKVLEKINGIPIGRLADVKKAFEKETDAHVIHLKGYPMPIILKTEEIAEAQKRISQRYQVTSSSYLGPEGAAL